eukprot:s3884_g7.t1
MQSSSAAGGDIRRPVVRKVEVVRGEGFGGWLTNSLRDLLLCNGIRWCAWCLMESNATSDAARLPLDFAEDLSDDVLSRVVLHCCAPDALCFATCSRSSLAAADIMAHRLFIQTFGTFDLPATLTKTAPAARAKIFSRLDRARPNRCPEHFRETFSWAAGHGYCTFLQAAAARQSWDAAEPQLVHLLNGRRKGSMEGIPPPLWRAAKRHQAAAVTLLLELRADPEPWFGLS